METCFRAMEGLRNIQMTVCFANWIFILPKGLIGKVSVFHHVLVETRNID